MDATVRLPWPAWARGGALLWRVACIAVAIVIVLGSLTPPADEPQGLLTIPDWIQHGLGYGVLTFTLIASQAQPRLWLSAIGLLVMGAILEGVQGFLGYRVAEFKDLIANGVGIVAVTMGALVLRKTRGGVVGGIDVGVVESNAADVHVPRWR